jgi:hypothetical protein
MAQMPHVGLQTAKIIQEKRKSKKKVFYLNIYITIVCS